MALGFFNNASTPEELARRRAELDFLASGMGRAQNAGQGFGDLLRGAGVGIGRHMANRQEKAGVAEAQAGWDNLKSTFNPFQTAPNPQISPVSASTQSQGIYNSPNAQNSVAASKSPSGDIQAQIYAGLRSRGMPDHVVRGVMGNMAVESRLDPGINEQNPLVAGSRGGFGLNQWTGPRRRAFEAYAKSKGVPLNDLNAQLDFTMQELQGPENAAYKKLMGTSNAEQAAQVYSNSFLRPGIPHLDRRIAETRKFAGMDFGNGQQPVQVASNDPGFMPQPASFQQPEAAPAMPQAPAPQPQQMAQGGDDARLQQLWEFSNSRAAQFLPANQKAALDQMLQAEMKKRDPAYQMQMQESQLGLEKTRLEMESLRNPKQKPIEVGGRLIDPVTYKPLYEPPVDTNDAGEWGLQPIPVRDPNTGKLKLMITNKSGSQKLMDLPEGYEPAPNLQYLDSGTGFVPVDKRGGAIPAGVSPVQKDVAGEAAATALGKEKGIAQGQLPAARITADQTISKIDELLASPNFGAAFGVESYMPKSIAGAKDWVFGTPDGQTTVDLRARVDQLRGSAFLEAYNGLRGGGQITEVEGKKAEDALVRLDSAQTDGAARQALKDFRDAVEQGYTKLQAKAGEQQQTTPAPAQPINDLPPGAVQDLLADPSPDSQAMFDEIFGPGAAKRALGGQ